MAVRPHVVVVPLVNRGHVNPLMHFSKILAAQGICITFVNSEHNDALMPPAERTALLRLGIRLASLPDGLPPHLNRTTHVVDLCASVLVAMPQPFDTLVARLLREQPPPSCILADTRLPFTLSTAAKFGLPHATFWTQSAASFASLLMVSNGSKAALSTEPHIPGASFLKEEDMNTFVRCCDRTDSRFQFILRGLDRLHESRWIFINTFNELESDTLIHLREQEHLETVLDVGPLLPTSLLCYNSDLEGNPCYAQTNETTTIWAEEEHCLNWLDQFEPKSVLYVSFGSLALVSPQQLDEIARGLEASGYPFIWVARRDLSNGHRPSFGEGFLRRVKERSCFVSWAPQLKVLSHRAVGGFLGHGGWNSTLEGISMGVPILGWPFFSDQPMNCTCIEEGWNTGLRLRRGHTDGQVVSRFVVEARVKDLMGSIKLSKKAEEWSSLAKKAALKDGSSYNNIQGFVNTLKASLGRAHEAGHAFSKTNGFAKFGACIKTDSKTLNDTIEAVI